MYESCLERHHTVRHAQNHGGGDRFGCSARGYYQGSDYVHRRYWTPEKGMENGLQTLQWLLKAPKEDPPGLIAFCKTSKKYRTNNHQSHAAGQDS
jgi:hypothetical protein